MLILEIAAGVFLGLWVFRNSTLVLGYVILGVWYIVFFSFWFGVAALLVWLWSANDPTAAFFWSAVIGGLIWWVGWYTSPKQVEVRAALHEGARRAYLAHDADLIRRLKG
jgi:hypothetical protein